MKLRESDMFGRGVMGRIPSSFFTAVAVFCIAMMRVGATTTSAMVCMNPSATVFWSTVSSPNPLVQLDWPAGATKAVLFVDGVEAMSVEDSSVTSCNVPVSMPPDRYSERFVDLSVEYLDSSDSVVGTASASLACVLGANGSTIPFVADSTSRRWSRYRGPSAMLPVPSETVSLAIDDVPVEGLCSPGWHWWRDASYGSHSLLFTLLGDEVPAEVFMGVSGMQIIFR